MTSISAEIATKAEPDIRATRLAASLTAAVAYLCRLQHPRGSWTDFWLPMGASDSWVTAYVGIALHELATLSLLDAGTRRRASAAPRRGALLLLQSRQPDGGWGYNGATPADTDSTAHAISLLARFGLQPPPEAMAFLRRHGSPTTGFRTYGWSDRDHRWCEPCADVSAAALRALYDGGEIDRQELALAWQKTLLPARATNSHWTGYWWTTPNYTTALALEVWALAGRPPLTGLEVSDLRTGCAFDQAMALAAAALVEDRASCAAGVAALLGTQNSDGGWETAPILRVPPQRASEAHWRPTIIAADVRRTFVTASALRGLAMAARRLAPADSSAVGARPAYRPLTLAPVRSDLGAQLDRTIVAAAGALGFSPPAAARAAQLLQLLTTESLADPSPWPSAQLSSLSGGNPVEFSAAVGPAARPALRFACEVGNPYLPPAARAASGLAAIARSADALGYDQAWRRILPALRLIVSPRHQAPGSLRFWVWAGLDFQPGEGSQRDRIVLKVYINLLNRQLGATRRRLEEALAAALIRPNSQVSAMLDLLDGAGFAQELGFALGPDGKIACKVYYELHGWRRKLARDLLDQAALPPHTDALAPIIPGVMSERLAAKSRAGIALRIDPASGACRELTTATAFPPALLPLAETNERVRAWIGDQGWEEAPYCALAALLLADWQRASPAWGRLHSLYTRTVSAEGSGAAIYLRPYLGETV